MSSDQCATFDFSQSNFILMIGGQLLLLVIVIMVLYFGADASAVESFPAKQMRNMISALQIK